MSDAAQHIATWEAAGLIDADTAGRLRAAEPAQPPEPVAASPGDGRSSSTIGQIFGPAVQVGEAFAYLGITFLLAASTAYVGRLASGAFDPEVIYAFWFSVIGAVLAGGGAWLLRGDDRRRRAAGVTWFASTSYFGAAGFAVAVVLLGTDNELIWVAAGAAALVAAIVYRLALPALVTQLALLGSLTTLAGALMTWMRSVLAPETFDGTAAAGAVDPLLLVVLEAGWWILLAVIIGLIGLREALDPEDDAAGRRAGLSRLWAGATVVLGVSSAAFRSAAQDGGIYGPVLEPWIGCVVVAIVGGVLIERAFRRGSTAFLVTGALGLIIALTQFNTSYLTDSTEAALLVEGVILLAIGFGANVLRGQLGRGSGPEAAAPLPG